MIARDASGANVPFLDSQSGAEVPDVEFDWNTVLTAALESIASRYANQAMPDKENSTYFVIPEFDDDDNIIETSEIIPSRVTINLDGEILEVDEDGGSERIEEIW